MRLQDLVVALVRACAGRVKDDTDVLELGHRDKAVDPSCVVATPMRWARARPSEAGSIRP
jgi:hypothetical protein